MGTVVISLDKPCCTVADLAAMLAMSKKTVYSIFKRESGVLHITHPDKKNIYEVLRIPTGVAQRVINRMIKID